LPGPTRIHAGNDPVNSSDPTGEMTYVEVNAGGTGNGHLSSISPHAIRQVVQRTLIGDPKRGEFGLIGDMIIDAMGQSILDMKKDSRSTGKPNSTKGSIAHGIFNAKAKQLNTKLKNFPISNNVTLAAEVSLDSNGNKSYAKGSMRIDAVIYYRGKAWVAFDMKMGANGVGNKISNKNHIAYEKRVRAMLFTIGFTI
jgi:hypothetical protein